MAKVVMFQTMGLSFSNSWQIDKLTSRYNYIMFIYKIIKATGSQDTYFQKNNFGFWRKVLRMKYIKLF